jgi:tetratricopeptide (TPR) repeat protein
MAAFDQREQRVELQLNVSGDLYFDNGTPLPKATPFTLPPDNADYEPRGDQEHELLELLDATDSDTTASHIALVGMPGIGKSTLALHAAHIRRDMFPDARLYIDLRGGGTQDLRPLESGEALAVLLSRLGLTETQIPPDLRQRAALFRSVLEQKFPRSLVILDNAERADQVEHLLPSCPGSVTIITSQHRLDSLPGLHTIELKEMNHEDGVALLERIVDQDRIQRDLRSAREIVDQCGGLPLALAIVGGTLKRRQHLSTVDYVKRLRQEPLDSLVLDHRTIRAVFTLSYQSLSSPERRLLRRLALLPGPTVVINACAVLIGSNVDETQKVIDGLVDAYLVRESQPHRYTVHELVRWFAIERLKKSESKAQQTQILNDLGRAYLPTVRFMNAMFQPETRRLEARSRAEKQGRPLREVEDALTVMALNWFDSEWSNLLACITQASNTGAHEVLWELVDHSAHYLDVRDLWDSTVQVNEMAAEAARSTGKADREAVAIAHIAGVYTDRRQDDQALEAYQRLVAIAKAQGHLLNEIRAEDSLGIAYQHKGIWNEAIRCHTRAVEVFREHGELREEAMALQNLGTALDYTNDQEAAFDACSRANDIFQDLGDWFNQSKTLTSMAIIRHRQGRVSDARRYYEAAWQLARIHGSPSQQHGILQGLGQVAELEQRWDDALEFYDRGLGIAQQLSDSAIEGQFAERRDVILRQRSQAESGQAREPDVL